MNASSVSFELLFKLNDTEICRVSSLEISTLNAVLLLDARSRAANAIVSYVPGGGMRTSPVTCVDQEIEPGDILAIAIGAKQGSDVVKKSAIAHRVLSSSYESISKRSECAVFVDSAPVAHIRPTNGKVAQIDLTFSSESAEVAFSAVVYDDNSDSDDVEWLAENSISNWDEILIRVGGSL